MIIIPHVMYSTCYPSSSVMSPTPASLTSLAIAVSIMLPPRNLVIHPSCCPYCYSLHGITTMASFSSCLLFVINILIPSFSFILLIVLSSYSSYDRSLTYLAASCPVASPTSATPTSLNVAVSVVSPPRHLVIHLSCCSCCCSLHGVTTTASLLFTYSLPLISFLLYPSLSFHSSYSLIVHYLYLSCCPSCCSLNGVTTTASHFVVLLYVITSSWVVMYCHLT